MKLVPRTPSNSQHYLQPMETSGKLQVNLEVVKPSVQLGISNSVVSNYHNTPFFL